MLWWTDDGIKFVAQSAIVGDHMPVGRRWIGSWSACSWVAVADSIGTRGWPRIRVNWRQNRYDSGFGAFTVLGRDDVTGALYGEYALNALR